MGVTIKDVARLVGVTPATVSMVINNKPRISDETRRKVMAAIEELDYYPHEGARALVLKRTNTLGVAAPIFTNYFVLETLGGIEHEIHQSDYNLVLYGTQGQSKTEDAVITRIARERKVDGLITINLQLNAKQIKYFQKNAIQVVSLEEEAEGYDSILVDNTYGANEAVKHLIALGHTRIALLTGPDRFLPMLQRETGYNDALKQAGLSPDPKLRLEVNWGRREEGFEVGQKILQMRQGPTAVFVGAGDVCATGLLLALKRGGLNVPKDISVVGFDDQPFAELVDPGLTTVRQPMARMGAEAFHLLKEALKDPEAHKPRKQIFPTELVVRQSTAAPRPRSSKE